MKSRSIHVQILAKIDASNNWLMIDGASKIVLKVAHDMHHYGNNCCVDFKIKTLNVDNEIVQLYLHADTNPEYLPSIKHYVIFLNDIKEVYPCPIIEIKKDKNNENILTVPALDLGLTTSRDINPDLINVFVIASAMFEDDEIEDLKEYAKNNHMIYAGICNLWEKNSRDFIMEHIVKTAIKLEDEKSNLKSIRESAFTRGAVAGALDHMLPQETGLHLGGFFSARDGKSWSLTCTSAWNTAKEEREKAEDKLSLRRLG